MRRAIEDPGEHLPSGGREIAVGERRQDVAQRAIRFHIGLGEQTAEDAASVVVARHLEGDGAREPQRLHVLRIELEQALSGPPCGRQMGAGLGDLDGAVGDRRVARTGGVLREPLRGHATVARGEALLAGALAGAPGLGARRRGVRSDGLRSGDGHAEQQSSAGEYRDRRAGRGMHRGATIAEP